MYNNNNNNNNNNIHTFISLNLDGILLSNMKYNEEIHQRKKSELGLKKTHTTTTTTTNKSTQSGAQPLIYIVVKNKINLNFKLIAL